jgi:hypothetical protein
MICLERHPTSQSIPRLRSIGYPISHQALRCTADQSTTGQTSPESVRSPDSLRDTELQSRLDSKVSYHHVNRVLLTVNNPDPESAVGVTLGLDLHRRLGFAGWSVPAQRPDPRPGVTPIPSEMIADFRAGRPVRSSVLEEYHQAG